MFQKEQKAIKSKVVDIHYFFVIMIERVRILNFKYKIVYKKWSVII